MSGEIPRLRMFAGPNGSGKSTLKTVLPRELLGVYLNPDEIELEMRTKGILDLHEYSVSITEPETTAFFCHSAFISDEDFRRFADSVGISEGRLQFDPDAVNSYVASATADLFRQHLLETRTTFTLETVMSHPSKVKLLEQAQRFSDYTFNLGASLMIWRSDVPPARSIPHCLHHSGIPHCAGPARGSTRIS